MAIRVKKLARELKCAPDQVLALLHDLGHTKYASPMDMLPDRPAREVREAARKGLPPARARRADPLPPRPEPEPDPDDFMAQVVAGVPTRGGTREPVPGSDLDVPLERLVSDGTGGGTGVVDEALAEATEALKDEERRLQARARDLAARGKALEQERAGLEAERDALLAERDRLRGEAEAAREQLEARAAALDALEAGGVPLGRLLDERGLRGADEQGRALAALAEARLLDALLARLRVVDPTPLRALLRDRLVLAGGPVSELTGVALVQVPEDRAEVPGGEALDRLRHDLAGELLLSGLTRARLVGGSAAELRLLRGGVDPRITLHLVPAAARDEAEARADLDEVDLVILWRVDETAAATQVYDDASAVVVRVADAGLSALLRGLRAGLADA